MSKLLKEAIADARAVKEVALQNAKSVLEEAFDSKLREMFKEKMNHDLDSDSDDSLGSSEQETHDAEFNENSIPDSAHTVDPQGKSNELKAGPKPTDTDETSAKTDSNVSAPGKLSSVNEKLPALNVEKNADTGTASIKEGEEDEDVELKKIIKELEDEMAQDEFAPEASSEFADESPDHEALETPGEESAEQFAGDDDQDIDFKIEDDLGGEPSGESDIANGEESPVADAAIDTGDGVTNDDEEINLDKIIQEMEEELNKSEAPSDGKLVQEVKSLRKENAEYKKAYKIVTEKLHEINMLNSKLLFTNKVFKSYGLNNSQKMKVVESFDRANTIREVKLTYANLCESFKIISTQKKKSSITEGIASKSVKSTKPSEKTLEKTKQILNEGSETVARLQKLAGIVLKS